MDADPREGLRKLIRGDDAAAVVYGTRPEMLDIRPKRGGWLALRYDALRQVAFDPDGEPVVTIEFSSHVIEVHGRKLEGLYSAVTTRRASILAEVSELYIDEEQTGTFIERMTVRKKAQGGPGQVVEQD